MGVILKNTGLEYFPVPKIACTSMKLAVFAHNEPDVKVTLRPPGVRDPDMIAFHHDGRPYRHVHQLYPSRLLRLRPWPLARGTRRFCLVRDPVKRFLSGYGNRVVFHNDLNLPEPPPLDEFLDRLDEFRRIPTIKHHFAPMFRFLGLRPGFYDRIFDIGELDQLAHYCAEHGAPLTIPHTQTGGPKIPESTLTAPMRRKVESLYRFDYLLYGRFLG